MPGIHFFHRGSSYRLPNPRKTTSWINKVARIEGAAIGDLNYVFVSDKFLLAMNQEYLNHNTYTDIITFGLGDGDIIEGEIYISIPRVRENARLNKVSFQD